MSKFDGTKNTGRAKKPPSHRMMRVNENIRFALSGIFTRGEIRDEYLKDVSVTVTEVRCSPDMRNATVYVIPFLGEDSEQVLLGLTRNKKYIRGQLTKLVSMKFMPVLTFVIDGSFGEAKHIEDILQSDKVQRDLKVSDDVADEDESDKGESDEDGSDKGDLG